jgi:hypothetical protein
MSKREKNNTSLKEKVDNKWFGLMALVFVLFPFLTDKWEKLTDPSNTIPTYVLHWEFIIAFTLLTILMMMYDYIYKKGAILKFLNLKKHWILLITNIIGVFSILVGVDQVIWAYFVIGCIMCLISSLITFILYIKGVKQ